jgi:PAS domain S-box-containing protein
LRLPWLAALALVVASLVPAWGAAPRRVTLQLKWTHAFQFAGFYAAQTQGYYRAEGLEVTFLEAGPSRMPLPVVEAGGAEFGISDMEVLRAYQEGRPLVALGVVFQHSPNIILALRKSGIHRPSDLAGRKVMFQGGQGLVETQAMLGAEGLRVDSLRQVPYSWNLDDLLKGRVDATIAYSTDEPYLLERRGAELVQLRPSDYGVDFYGDLLFTTKAFAANNPAVTEAFRRASFLGWEYAMEHPGELIDHILTLPGVAARGATREKLQFEADQMQALLLPRLVDAGHMNPGRFRHIAEIMVQQGLIKTVKDPQDFLFQPAVLPAWTRALKMALLVLAGSGLLVVLWILQLRRTVRTRTKALRDEVRARRQTDGALREAHQFNEQVIHSAREGIIVYDLDLRYQVWNPFMEQLSGMPAREVVGKRPLEVFPFLREAGIPERLNRVLAGEAVGSIDFPYSVPNAGTSGWTTDTSAPFRNAEGEIIGVITTVSDITDRKRTEDALRVQQERLNLAVAATGLGLYDWNPKTGAVVFSELWAAMFGYRVEELTDSLSAWSERVHPDDLPGSQKAFQVACQADTPYLCEYRMRHRDGSWRWILDQGRVVARDAQGEVIRFVGANLDITDRKQREAETAALEGRNRQLQKAESLGRMAGSMAHHFNNKLQAVMGNLELLGELPKGMDPTNFLIIAKQATEQAAEMSRLLLVYLGQNSGKGEPHCLAELCRSSLPFLQSALPSTVTLETDCSMPGPVICLDAGQFQQILNSLVTNAWEAMGDAGGQIRLSLQPTLAIAIPTPHRFPIGWQPQEAEYACLAVADTGGGIAETEIEKLFDPFFSTKFIGRGLGLSVVLGMVMAHGGAITVESVQGQGSVFRVFWPISTESVPSLPEPEVEAPTPEGGGTILVVDDDPMLLESTGGMIERLGFTALTAQDGIEALAVFRQHQAAIRCVITDLTMPRSDGWETLTALRQLDPNLPVILASGYDKAQVLSGTHADLPQVFLGKPFRLQQLRDAVEQALTARG